MLQLEHWRPVVENPAYEISNIGHVKSHRSGTEKWLRPGLASHGYRTVSLGRGNTRCIHRLISEAFLGPRLPGQVVLHDDGVRTNSRLSNLRYGSYEDNIADARRHGTYRGF